jgi:PKD repeat protein
VYKFTAVGDYSVSLTVVDAEGATATKTSTVTISEAGNTPPIAGFEASCTASDCSFTSTSSDAAPGTIVTYAWNFGDGSLSDLQNPTHGYTVTEPTDFTVTLTVTDNEGATGFTSQTVSVTPAPNTPPTAAFTSSCNATICTFTNTSSDAAPGTIATYAWTFGDGGISDVASPTHGYIVTATTNFTVTLTVTDNQGATGVATQTVTVSPPPPGAEGCVTSGTRIDCLLNIPARSTIKLKLVALSCDIDGSRITAPPPIGDQVFLDVCFQPVGRELGIFGGPEDEAIIYEAGSQVHLRYNRGPQDPDEPAYAPPSATFTGTFPNWTINFEDGAHAGDAGEPDFSDIVLGVTATEVR